MKKVLPRKKRSVVAEEDSEHDSDVVVVVSDEPIDDGREYWTVGRVRVGKGAGVKKVPPRRESDRELDVDGEDEEHESSEWEQIEPVASKSTVKRKGSRSRLGSEDDDEEFGHDDDDDEDEDEFRESRSRRSSRSSSSASSGRKVARTASARPARRAISTRYADANSDDEFDYAPAKPARAPAKPRKESRAPSPDRLTPVERSQMQHEKRELDVIHGWRFKSADEGVPSPVHLDKRLKHLRAAQDLAREKEFFVSWKDCSHLSCEWLSEAKVKFLNRIKHSNFVKKNPDPVSPDNDPPIPAEWLVCTRVIDEDEDGNALCLWGGLEYERATWENVSALADNVMFNEQLIRYQTRLARIDGSVKLPKSKPRPAPEAAKKFAALTAEEIGLAVPPFPHQVEGISWLMYKWVQGENVILGDEMGLGKTCQTIGVLNVLQRLFLRRRFLVVAPLTTLANWVREVHRFLPACDVVVLSGSETSRSLCYEKDMKHGAFDVVVTSYEVAMNNIKLLNFEWDAMVLDEGHRVKNVNSVAAQKLRSLKTDWIVILTGTPVQNNPEELTNLLCFLRMKGLESPEVLAQKYSMENLKNPAVLNELHQLVRPRLLRRVKEDVDLGIPEKVEVVVPVDLAALQLSQYKHILSQNFNALARVGQDAKRKKPLCNIFAQLRKVAQHPYLFPEAELRDPNMSREVEYQRLIEASGKLKVLDAMLTKLKAAGHRVLIFSQYVIMLDVLEDFLEYRGYIFERIDGSTQYASRQQAIDRFNAPGSDRFCFLLSTRATRLGINLASADTVIIYDADFNPQNDLQALSRAHRMGQTKCVAVYTLVARNTVEQRLVEVARSKRFLEHIVVESIEEEMDTSTLNQMLMDSSQKLFSESEKPMVYDDAAISALLHREAHVKAAMERAKAEKKVKKEAEGERNDSASSFRFARVWEVSESAKKEDDDEAEKKTTDTASFWAELLADERRRMQEAEEAKANMYGKGKRNRSQVNMSVSNFFPDSDDSESSFEEGNKPYWSFVAWLRKEHPGEIGNRASQIWTHMPVSAKDTTIWWRPEPAKSELQVAGVTSVETFKALPPEEIARCKEAARLDELRFQRETQQRMPDVVAHALEQAREKERDQPGPEANSEEASTKKRRGKAKGEAKKDKAKEKEKENKELSLAYVEALGLSGQKLSTKQKNVLRYESLRVWLAEHHPLLLKVATMDEIVSALRHADEWRRCFKGNTMNWKPVKARGAFHFFRAAQAPRLTKELKAANQENTVKEAVVATWVSLTPAQVLEYHKMAAESEARFAREKSSNLPDCLATLLKEKRAEISAAARMASSKVEVEVVDVDNPQVPPFPQPPSPQPQTPQPRPGDEDLEREMTATVARMSAAEKRALRDFIEEEAPRVKRANPMMRELDCDICVLNAFNALPERDRQARVAEAETLLRKAASAKKKAAAIPSAKAPKPASAQKMVTPTANLSPVRPMADSPAQPVVEDYEVVIIKPRKLDMSKRSWMCLTCKHAENSEQSNACAKCKKQRPKRIVIDLVE